MGRFKALIGVVALVVTGCAGAASPAASQGLATQTPGVASAAPSAPEPTPTAVIIPVQVTFDGKTCTYAGPSTVPAGTTLEWTFANTPLAIDGYGSGLFVAPVVDGTTWEQILSDLASEPRASVVPDWLKIPGLPGGPYQLIASLYDDSAAAGITLKTTLARDAYYVGCNTNPEGGDRAFPAILIKVLKG